MSSAKADGGVVMMIVKSGRGSQEQADRDRKREQAQEVVGISMPPRRVPCQAAFNSPRVKKRSPVSDGFT